MDKTAAPQNAVHRLASWLGALLLGAALAWGVSLARTGGSPADTGFRGIAGTEVRFATPEQARAVLSTDDAWVAATSALQRRALVGAGGEDLATFRQRQAEAARPCSAAQRERWGRALDALVPAFNRLRVPLPPQVLLVCTTGRESANQPHTRGAAVVLPAALDTQGYSDAELLAHELFHVMSRHQPAFASALYAVVGFEPVAPLQWPAHWAERRIANQDAPEHRHAMRLLVQGRPVVAMPVVVAGEETGAGEGHASAPSGDAGEGLSALIEVRLLEVTPGGGGTPTHAVMRDGEPLWHDPDATPDYLARLGGNTDYTLHPEETLADNFMQLVSGRRVPTPALLQRIETLFLARR